MAQVQKQNVSYLHSTEECCWKQSKLETESILPKYSNSILTIKSTWVPKLKLKPCVFQIVSELSEYSTLSPTKNHQFGPHQELQFFLVGPKTEDKLVSFQTLTQSIPVWTPAKS